MAAHFTRNETVYSVVYGNGVMKETDSFTADEAEFLYADADDFASAVENGKVVVELKATKMIDSEGNEVEEDGTVKVIMQKLADEAEHDLSRMTVISDDGSYYTFVKYNVNWQNLCALYRYDGSEGKLTEVCRWDNVEMTGTALD